MKEPPVRICCITRHNGVVCPDGLVMCCLCFTRVSISELSVENGKPVNVCNSCRTKEQVRQSIR